MTWNLNWGYLTILPIDFRNHFAFSLLSNVENLYCCLIVHDLDIGWYKFKLYYEYFIIHCSGHSLGHWRSCQSNGDSCFFCLYINASNFYHLVFSALTWSKNTLMILFSCSSRNSLFLQVKYARWVIFYDICLPSHFPVIFHSPKIFHSPVISQNKVIGIFSLMVIFVYMKEIFAVVPTFLCVKMCTTVLIFMLGWSFWISFAVTPEINF